MILQQQKILKILVLAAAIQFASVAYYLGYANTFGYLPSPFVVNKFDTFMDLYNTMWHGAGDGRYTDWGSVYPPLNFILVDCLRAIFFPQGVFGDPLDLQAADVRPALFIAAMHLVGPFFIVGWKDWHQFTGLNRILIGSIAAMSAIFLFSLERANIIIWPLYLLPVIFNRQQSMWATTFLALAINFKPYFALLLFGYLFVGDYRRFMQATALAGGIFIFTGLALDANFPMFIANILSFAGNDAVLSGREVLALPASLSGFSYAISIFIKTDTTANLYGTLLPVLPSIIETVKFAILLVPVAALFWARRSLQIEEAFTVLLLIVVTAGIWAGGYSQMFYIATVPVLARMSMRWAHLSIMLAIFMPWDLITLHTDSDWYMMSYISHSIVDVHWQLGLGTILRPLLNCLLILSISLELFSRERWVLAPLQPRMTFS